MGQRGSRVALQARNSGRVRKTEPAAAPRRAGPARRRARPGALTRLSVPAHAKINLYLKILGKRPDGYHEIETAVQTVSLYDTLFLEPRDEGITLEADDPAIPSGPENLAARAAAALPQPPDGPRGVHIRIRKRIPAGAGLGGGSSDAAATLIGLRRLWNLDLSRSDLERLAAGLGADVPFFLHGGTALLKGTGTRVEPLPDLLGHRFVIAFPGVSLATREVYAAAAPSLTSALKISSMPPFEPTLKGDLREDFEAWVRAGNDLEPAARALCPAIGEISERLLAAGAASASLTGSGSAVYGIFRDTRGIERALASMRAVGFAAVQCIPLGREEYSRRVGLGERFAK